MTRAPRALLGSLLTAIAIAGLPATAGATQGPVVTTSSGVTVWTQGDNVAAEPAVVDPALTVVDAGGSTLASATVQITGGLNVTEDVLAFDNDGVTMGNIDGSYDPSSGTSELTSAGATATVAQWQSALASVTYTDIFQAMPDTAPREVTIVVDEGGGSTSVPVTKTIDLTAVDQSPAVTTSSGSVSWMQGDNTASEPVVVDSGVTVSDSDNATLASATVTITGNLHAGEDVLGFVNDDTNTLGNISGSYDPSSGIYSLVSAGGTATVAQWQAALAAVTFTDTAVVPNPTTRIISFTANDGTQDSTIRTRLVTVSPTDQTPIVTTSGGSSVWTQGDNEPSTPVVVDSGVTLTDGNDATLTSANVQIVGHLQTGEDELAFANDDADAFGDVESSYDASTGVLFLHSATGAGTVAQYQAALAAVTYTNSAASPDTGARTIAFSADDGIKNSGQIATHQVTLTATDQSPVVTTSNGSTAWTQGDNTAATPVVVDGGVTLTDGNDATLTSANVEIVGHLQTGEDELAFANDDADAFGDVESSYDASTGVLFLHSATGAGTVAQYQAALAAVTYTNSAASPDTGARTIAFSADDGIKNSGQIATHQVTLTATDQSPVVTTSNGSTAWTQGDNTAATPVVVDGDVTVTDADNTTLASATVAITGNYQEGEDVLDFINDGDTMGNVTGSFEPATGVETLTSAGATATVSQWQNALAAVTYTDTASAEDTGDRTVSFTADDGTVDSAEATKTVTVASVGQSPVVTTTGGTTAWVEAIGGVPTTPVKVDHTIVATDTDSTSLPAATVAITGGLQSAEDVLAFANDGTTMGDVTASYVAGTGVLTLDSAAGASPAEWQAALRAVTYANTASAPDTDTRTITFTLDDGAQSGSGDQTLSVTATDQTPIIGGGGNGGGNGGTPPTDGHDQTPTPPVDQTPAPPAADTTPPTPPVAPPVVPTPPKLPVAKPLAKITLHVALPSARRSSVRTTARGHLKVACTVATTKASTCTVDVFATDPSKASAAAVRGRVLGRGTIAVRAGHRGAVSVDVALNANGRSLVRRHPHGVSVEVRITASSKGVAPVTLTRQARLLG